MESTAKLREINDLITILKEENKTLDQKKAENVAQIEELERLKAEEGFKLLKDAKPGEKSVKVDGLTITRATLTSYEGYDLSSRSFATERKQFRQLEAEALRKKADQIEKGDEEISESKLLKYILSISTGIEKMKKFETTREIVKFRNL
ncbi:MAG: hypothetical protein ACI3ZC_02295 [Candidatus Cryptobacteroides sp.]